MTFTLFEFKNLLAHERSAKELSTADFAQELGIPAEDYETLERGIHALEPRFILALSEALGYRLEVGGAPLPGMDLGPFIRASREEAGMSLEDVAERADLLPVAVQQMEAGTPAWNFLALDRVLEAVGRPARFVKDAA